MTSTDTEAYKPLSPTVVAEARLLVTLALTRYMELEPGHLGLSELIETRLVPVLQHPYAYNCTPATKIDQILTQIGCICAMMDWTPIQDPDTLNSLRARLEGLLGGLGSLSSARVHSNKES